MRRAIRVTSLLLWFLLAGPLPAYANDAPEADGMLSLLMIFPIAILGLRLAGAKLPPGGTIKRFLIGLALGFSALASVVFLGSGGFALGGLMMLCYGWARGGRAIKHGQGRKRFAIGLAVILFTLLAVADYLASFTSYRYTTQHAEYNGISAVRAINTAEITFRSDANLHANKKGVGEFGTIEQLVKAGLLDDGFLKHNPSPGYRYVVVLSADPAHAEKEFFVYATPEHYGSPGALSELLPGFSLWAAARPPKLQARRTFASDETGVIRAADLGTARAVTREEAEKWKALD